jgi:hypothetical protein
VIGRELKRLAAIPSFETYRGFLFLGLPHGIFLFFPVQLGTSLNIDTVVSSNVTPSRLRVKIALEFGQLGSMI